MIRDWTGVKGWCPEDPHTPIGLLGAMLAWHGAEHLDDRPAAVDMAREAEELATARARVAAQHVERAAAREARGVAVAALGGPGHTAARAAAAEASRRAVSRRTASVAADVARLDAAVRAARGTKQGPFHDE